MKKTFVIALAAALLIGFTADAAARGRHRTSVGLYFGTGPGWWGGTPYYWRRPFFYDPWYDPWYAPRTVIIEREPPVYIQRPQVAPQQQAAPAAPAAPRVWYYCTDPAGYYPYVPNCNQPWVSVDPSSVPPPPPRQ